MRGENIKTYILDASFILAFLLPDEQVERVDDIFMRYQEGVINFISSPILPLEVINGLKYTLARGRINKQTALNLIQDFLMVKINIIDIDLEKTFKISLNSNQSVYDASYLYLAKKQKMELLTLDDKLKKLT